MSKLLLLTLLSLATASLFAKKDNKDMTMRHASYIVTDHEVRLFDEGNIHRKLFSWSLEPHAQLKNFIKQYDNIILYEIFIKNDCSKKYQLIVFTFKNGYKSQIMVDDFIVYGEADPSTDSGFSIKKSGTFVSDKILAKYKIVSSRDILVASKFW